MLSLLLDNKVEFLLVGAYALAAHGFPRAIGDIDIFVKPGSENASILYKTIKKFGVPLEDISTDNFAHPGIILQTGVAPRIDTDCGSEDASTYDFIGFKLP